MEVLRIIENKCHDLGLPLDPTDIMVDFELATMNAIGAVFGNHVNMKGCFFHLCQNTWRHIQDMGLSAAYKDDDDIKLWCGMLDALAFLPTNEIPAGIQFLS